MIYATLTLATLLAAAPTGEAKDRFAVPEEVRQKYSDLQRMRQKPKSVVFHDRRLTEEPAMKVKGLVHDAGDGTVLLAVEIDAARAARLPFPRVSRPERIEHNTIYLTQMFVRYGVADEFEAPAEAVTSDRPAPSAGMMLDVAPFDLSQLIRRQVVLTLRRSAAGAALIVRMEVL